MIRKLLGWGESKAESEAVSDALQPAESALITAVWQKTALPRSTFDDYYLPVILFVRNAMSSIPNRDDDNVSQWLEYIDKLLRNRKAVILPRGSSSEKVALLGELYTYAIFCAVALDTAGTALSSFVAKQSDLAESDNPFLTGVLPRGNKLAAKSRPIPGAGLALVTQAIPVAAWHWLSGKREVLEDFVGFFFASDASDIYWFVSGKHKTTADPLAPSKSPKKGLAQELQVQSPAKQQKVTSRTEDLFGDRDNSVDQAPSKSKRPEQPRKEGQKRALGWLLVDDINAAVKSGELTINQEDSFIHLDRVGRLLIDPQLFGWLTERSDVEEKVVKNRFRRLKLHEVKANGMDLHAAEIVDGKWVNGMKVEAENANRYFNAKNLTKGKLKFR